MAFFAAEAYISAVWRRGSLVSHCLVVVNIVVSASENLAEKTSGNASLCRDTED